MVTTTINYFQVQDVNNTWHPICMDWSTWNTTYADLACQNLGFSGSLALESIPKPENSSIDVFYKLDPSLSVPKNNHLKFKKMNETCDQIASIACQENGKLFLSTISIWTF